MKGRLVFVVIKESMLTDRTWIVDIFANQKDAKIYCEGLEKEVDRFTYKDSNGDFLPRYKYYVDEFVIQ